MKNRQTEFWTIVLILLRAVVSSTNDGFCFQFFFIKIKRWVKKKK